MGAISERNFCEICRRKSPQNTEKHKTKLCAEVPERPPSQRPLFSAADGLNFKVGMLGGEFVEGDFRLEAWVFTEEKGELPRTKLAQALPHACFISQTRRNYYYIVGPAKTYILRGTL